MCRRSCAGRLAKPRLQTSHPALAADCWHADWDGHVPPPAVRPSGMSPRGPSTYRQAHGSGGDRPEPFRCNPPAQLRQESGVLSAIPQAPDGELAGVGIIPAKRGGKTTRRPSAEALPLQPHRSSEISGHAFTDYTHTPRPRGDVRAVGRAIPRGWPFTSKEGWPCTRQHGPEDVDVGVRVEEVEDLSGGVVAVNPVGPYARQVCTVRPL